MSRAIFLRFKPIALLSSIRSGFARITRVAGLGVLCLGLSACVEGVDLPEFVTTIQEAGIASQTGGQQSEKQVSSYRPSYLPRNYKAPTHVNSEALLDAKGNWNIVEQGGAMDPTQAHLNARKNVNVRRRKNKDEFTPHFQPNAKSGEDGKMRVLRLQRGGETFSRDASKYDIAESSVVKPTHTVAEGDLLKKIKALFGEEDAGAQSIGGSQRYSERSGIIMPGRKPGREAAAEVKPETQKRGHKIGSVVVPPELPAQKMPKALAGEKASKKIIIPRMKPSVSAYEIVQNATSGQREYIEAVKVRSGKHKGKTRLVIEITKPTEYKVAIDHVRKVLRVKLENTHWAMAPQDKFDKSALLGTYIARDEGDGSTLFEVRLEKESKILDTVLLRPNLSSQHRVVIDLAD